MHATWYTVEREAHFTRSPYTVIRHAAGGLLVAHRDGSIVATDPQNALELIQDERIAHELGTDQKSSLAAS